MKRRLSIDELQRLYRVELPHARHVADLADKLFVAVRGRFRLRPSDRRVLAAAAALHLLAPPSAAARRRRGTCPGACHVLRQGLAGFGAAERRIVALAVAMQGAPRPLRRPLSFAAGARSDLERARRLAALLRLADAMDFIHIQDTTIVDFRARSDDCVATLLLHSAFSDPDRIRAATDLWECVFGEPLELRFHRTPRAAPFDGVVGLRDTSLEALRRILYTQFRIMQTSLDRMGGKGDTIGLHDFRVALRRLRSVLRMFAPLLKKSQSMRLTDALGTISKRLGPFRDGQAWMDFVDAQRTQHACGGTEGWKAYVRGRRRSVEAERAELRRVCHAEILGLMEGVERFLRADPLWDDAERDPPFALFAAARLARAHESAERAASSDATGMNDEQLHAMRKRYRRARYWAEFTAPALGPRVQELAQAFKTLADRLGVIHDMDVQLRGHARGKNRSPGGLIKYMRRRRRKELDAYVMEKDVLAKKKFRKAMRNMLWNMGS